MTVIRRDARPHLGTDARGVAGARALASTATKAESSQPSVLGVDVLQLGAPNAPRKAPSVPSKFTTVSAQLPSPPKLKDPGKALELALQGQPVQLVLLKDPSQPIEVSCRGKDEANYEVCEISQGNHTLIRSSRSSASVEALRDQYEAETAQIVPLSVRLVGQGNGMDAYEASVGEVRLGLSVATGTEVSAPLTTLLTSYSQLSAALRQDVVALTVEKDSEDFKLTYRSAQGTPKVATIHRSEDENALRVYDLESGGAHLRLKTDAMIPWEAAAILKFYDQEPAAFRGMLHTVRINHGSFPEEAQTAARMGLKSLKAAATAANGEIDFWNGDLNLQAETFAHEFGHIVGQHFSTSSFHSVEWEQAIASDATPVSDYAEVNPDEDFAETWMKQRAIKAPFKLVGEKTPSLDEFQQRYPARAAILQAIDAGELKPLR